MDRSIYKVLGTSGALELVCNNVAYWHRDGWTSLYIAVLNTHTKLGRTFAYKGNPKQAVGSKHKWFCVSFKFMVAIMLTVPKMLN